MSTINTLTGVVPVKAPYTLKKLLAEPEIGSDPKLLYGVELEIENCDPEDPRRHRVPGMEYHEDGSLRNNGAEFVTQPMKMRELSYVLKQFFMKNEFTEENYSERCSVHVHCNVGDLSLDQLTVVLMLYQVYERALFAFVGAERDKNIFCVPWYDTALNYSLLDENMLNNTREWQKYTALNLLPIWTQGTIEFRHMPGVHDPDTILLWCNVIGKMFAYARTHSTAEIQDSILSLNSSSRYQAFTFEVFGEYALYLMNGLEANMEKGVIALKYSMMAKKKAVKKPTKQQIIFNDMLAAELVHQQVLRMGQINFAEGAGIRVGGGAR